MSNFQRRMSRFWYVAKRYALLSRTFPCMEVSACEKGSKWDTALGLFTEFLARAPAQQNPASDRADIVMYNADAQPKRTLLCL